MLVFVWYALIPYVLSSFAISLTRNRELVDLFHCLSDVLLV